MNSLIKYDRVVLTKDFNAKINKVGEVFEVASVSDIGFVLRDVKTKIAMGVVSFEDFDKYFVKEEEFNSWTPWIPMMGIDGHSDVFYRTNRKRVQVRFLTDKVRGESCCHKTDEFDLFFGIHIAYLRCRNKVLTKNIADYEYKLNKMIIELKDNNKIVERMIDSLDV